MPHFKRSKDTIIGSYCRDFFFTSPHLLYLLLIWLKPAAIHPETELSHAGEPHGRSDVHPTWREGLPRRLSGKEPTCKCRGCIRQVWSLGVEDPLEEGMATHSSVLAWRIPLIKDPGGLHKESDTAEWLSRHTHTHTHTHTLTNIQEMALPCYLNQLRVMFKMSALWKYKPICSNMGSQVLTTVGAAETCITLWTGGVGAGCDCGGSTLPASSECRAPAYVSAPRRHPSYSWKPGIATSEALGVHTAFSLTLKISSKISF